MLDLYLIWRRVGRRNVALVAYTLLIGLMASPVRAADFSYEVSLNVPDAYRTLLENNLNINQWHDNPAMNLAQLQRLYDAAPANISDLLSTEGYFAPRITSNLQQTETGWQASFSVDPGEPVHVAGVDLQVQVAITQTPAQYDTLLARLRQQWSLKSGALFRQADWEAAKRNALKGLLTEQYPAAHVADSAAVVNPESGQVDLRVILDSGPAFSFGKTTISGLERYPASVVERLNPIEPGMPYSQAKLLAFQSALQARPYFKSVSVTAETDPAHPDAVPVQVTLVEFPSSKLAAGIGVSSDNGVRGQLEYQNLNVLQRAWRFKTALKIETNQDALDTELALPRNDLGYLDSISASRMRTDIEGQRTLRYGVGVKRTRLKGRVETTLSTQFQTERQSIAGAQGDNVQALSLNYIWTYRNLDNPLFPTRGYIFSAQLGGASRAVLSDQDFIRGYVRGVYYYPISNGDGLILRGEFGSVLATSRVGIPSDFLFRTGGDQTVRGYAYQSLGVRQGDAIVGGRYLAVASAEYVHWLTPNWGAATFYDMGDAADTLPNLKLVSGYGLGARWRSPVGALNLDLAYGQATQSVRLHFSAGVSF